MSKFFFDIIIVGSGNSGLSLIRKIRSVDNNLKILVLTSSLGLEYDKTLMSCSFSSQVSPSEFIINTKETISEIYNVTIFSNFDVTVGNAENKTIGNQSIQFNYDKLIIATGAVHSDTLSFMKSSDRVFEFNHYEDYSKIYPHLIKNKYIVVIGSGMTGLEICNDLVLSGKKVTLVSRSKLLSKYLPDEVCSFYEDKLVQAGLSIKYADGFSFNESHNTKLLEIILNSGDSIYCDIIIDATGLVPNTKLALYLGCEVNHGIVCDKFLQTSLPDVYALGDCAEVDGIVDMFIDSSNRQSDVLANNILGYRTEFKRKSTNVILKSPLCPIFWFSCIGIKNLTWYSDSSSSGLTSIGVDENNVIRSVSALGSEVKMIRKLLSKLDSKFLEAVSI